MKTYELRVTQKEGQFKISIAKDPLHCRYFWIKPEQGESYKVRNIEVRGDQVVIFFENEEDIIIETMK